MSKNITAEKIVCISLLVCSAILVMMPIYDYDVFWHLANGREMISQSRIIQYDIFSYTAYGTHFQNHEWLSQLILYIIFKMAGSAGLIFLTSIGTIITLICILKTIDCNYKYSRQIGCFIGFIAIVAGITRYVPRPQIFSFIGIGIITYLLAAFNKEPESKKTYLIYIAFCILIWNFLHGALYGLILISCELIAALSVRMLPNSKYIVDNIIPKKNITFLFYTVATCYLLSIYNPIGFDLSGLLKTFLFESSWAQFTVEFTPTQFNKIFILYWIILGITCIYILRDIIRREICLRKVIPLVVFGILSIRYIRATAPFALLTIPYLTEKTASIITDLNKTSRITASAFNSAIYSLLIITILITFSIKTGKLFGENYRFGLGINNGPDSKYPIGSTNFVNSSEIKGNLYNSNNFGGYLAFYLAKGKPIFHYNHPLLFPDIYKIVHNKSEISKYNINYAIIGSSIETQYLFKSPDWVPVYWENNSIVLVKNDAINKEIINRFQIFFFYPEITKKDVDDISANPINATKLALEMSTYLKFRNDKRIFRLFIDLINKSSVQIDEDTRKKIINDTLLYNSLS